MSLGRAFISVHADTSPFAREVRQGLRKLAIDLREDTDRAGNLIGQRLGLRARQGMRQAFGRRDLNLNAKINLSQTSLARTEAALRVATRNREVDVRVNRRGLLRSLGLVGSLVGTFVLSLVRIFGDLFNFGRQIGQIFGEAFKNLSAALSSSTAAAVSLSSAIVQLAAAAAALTVVIVLLVGIFGVLLAILIPVVETVQLLLTLMPGLAAAFLFAIGPLVLVFSNLGKAIKATSEEAEAFQNAIEELGPNTRSSLRGLRELVQFFQSIRKAVQESFFGPISEAVRELDGRLGPTFRQGFIDVAEAAGEFAGKFIELFDHPMAIPFFDALFGLAELGFEQIGDAIINLIGAFANLTDESIPNVRRGIDGIADTINGWADSINDFANDPNFQETIEDWEESFTAVRDLLSEIGRLAGNLIDGFREDGIPVMEQFTGMIEKLNEFLESDTGAAFFDGLRISAQFLLIVLQSLVTPLVFMITLIGRIEQAFKKDVLGAVQLLFSPLTFIITRLVDWRAVLTSIKDWWDRIVAGVRRFVDILSGRGIPLTGTLRSIVSGISLHANILRSRLSGALNIMLRMLSPIRHARTALAAAAGFARTINSVLSGAAFWAGQIRDRINSIRIPSLGGLAGIAGLAGRAIFGQEGMIITRPTSLIAGEAGPEVLIPLTRPDRARELLVASGLANMIRGGDGAFAGMPGATVPSIHLIFESDGGAASDAILEVLRRGVRIRGGNVQQVIGQ
jgi:hypothetical protein